MLDAIFPAYPSAKLPYSSILPSNSLQSQAGDAVGMNVVGGVGADDGELITGADDGVALTGAIDGALVKGAIVGAAVVGAFDGDDEGAVVVGALDGDDEGAEL